MSDYKFETLQLHVGQEQADPATDARASFFSSLISTPHCSVLGASAEGVFTFSEPAYTCAAFQQRTA